MAGNEAEEILSILISSSGKVVQTANDIVMQVIKFLGNFINSRGNRGFNKDQKESLAKKGRAWIKNQIPKLGEHGQISVGKLSQREGDMAYTEVSREDLADLKKSLKKHGVDFAVIPNKDDTYHLLFKAQDAQVMQAAVMSVAKKMGMSEKEIQELSVPDISTQDIQEKEIQKENLPTLPAPTVDLTYAKQDWTLNETSPHLVYQSAFESYDLTASSDGTYKVEQIGKEIYKGKSVGGLQSAMLDATVAARSHSRNKELKQGLENKTLGADQKKVDKRRTERLSPDKLSVSAFVKAQSKTQEKDKTQKQGKQHSR